MKKSHTNVSWVCTNLISACTNFNTSMMQANPITTSMYKYIGGWSLLLPQYANHRASLPLEFCIIQEFISNKQHGDPPSLYITK
jgi:hypothetical protein